MTGPSAPRRLRTDFRDAPIDIDAPPLLSWEPDGRQDGVELEFGPTGGQTTVERRWSASTGWDLPLPAASMTGFRWRVRTVLADRWSPWSTWSRFETALLHESDWGDSLWIRSAVAGPSPVLSARFDGAASSGLRLAVSGLGVVDVRVNGSAVSEAVLDPPPSAYDAIVHYRLWDVSELVRPGTNTLTARLGRGFYAMTTPTAFGWHTAPWRDVPKLRAVLYDAGHPGRPLLVSDGTWSCALTTVTEDSFYTGEIIDFRRPPAACAAIPATAPAGVLRISRQPPITRRERVDIVGTVRTGSARHRFELAANVAGMVAVTTEDTSSPTLHVKLGEKLGETGDVLADDPAVPGGLQRSIVIGAPSGVTIPFDLSYAGLRYAEVSGTAAPVSIAVDRVSAAPTSIGSFSSSDPLLDTIHRITRLTIENCLQGTPVDTPLYEKQGYTGDAQLLAETYAYNYWMPNYLGGWFESSVLPSLHDDGSLPGIAPSPPGDWIFDTPSPAWDAVLFEVPETLARHYGDLSTMRRSLPALRRYLGFLAERFPGGIVDVGLGDWNAPGHIMPPEHPAIVSTAYHYRFLRLMASFLRRVGDSDDAIGYAARAEALRARFDEAFWRADGWYAGPGGGAFRQTDNLLAISFGLATGERRSAVLDSLESDLRDRGMHLDTGMVGTRQLLRVLAHHHPRLAFEVVRAPGYPGWSHWIDNGATTLYENWELDGRSHDHAMFGTVDEWLFADVAGLSPGADGWSVVRVDPRLPGDGSFACRAAVDTISGPIDAEWEDRGTSIRGRVTAPSHVPVVVPGTAGAERLRSVRRGRLTEHTIELAVPTAP